MKDEIKMAHDAVVYELQQKLETELREPRFTIKDTEIRHRNITHWGNEGLLIGDFQKGKWRRFNYLEIIWLRMIAHLRSFEIPLELIRTLKHNLCEENISIWDLYQEREVREVTQELAGNKTIIPPPSELAPQVIQAMKSMKTSNLFFIVSDAVLFRNHWMILLNHKGDFIPLKLAALEEQMKLFQLPEFIKSSFVAISLSEVISESFKKIDVDILADRISVLTQDEAEVLKHLRCGGLKSLKITFGKGEEIDLIEETRSSKVDPAARFSDVIWSKGYQTITAKTQDGKVTHFEISTRFKLT
jgi:DNA-binding transcriptional MerR regulator